MIQYVFKRMISEMKETIGNTLVVSCIVAVLTICFQIVRRLTLMLDNDWYKNSMEVAAIGDYYIREKMGVIISVVFVIIGILYLFCVVIYGLKLKLDIMKERTRISVFQILGYTRMQMLFSLYIGKILELIIASFVGCFVAYSIWSILCKQKKFLYFMTLINEDIKFQVESVGVNIGGLLILSFIVIYWVLRKNVHMMDMKGEE